MVYFSASAPAEDRAWVLERKPAQHLVTYVLHTLWTKMVSWLEDQSDASETPHHASGCLRSANSLSIREIILVGKVRSEGR
jgi:hypothetical protein